MGQERMRVGREIERERVGREKERERECGERESVLHGNRESGTREKEWGICEKSKRESLFRDAWWG